MMRVQPVVAILALVGLFAVSVLVGYVGGQTFLTPATSQRPRPARPVPVPESPPTPPQTTPLTPAPSPRSPALDLPTSGRTPVSPEPVSPPQLVPPAPPPAAAVLFRVQVGAFISRENAEARAVKLREEGFDAYVSQSGTLWKVQVGAFAVRENAERLAEQLRNAGYEVLITP